MIYESPGHAPVVTRQAQHQPTTKANAINRATIPSLDCLAHAVSTAKTEPPIKYPIILVFIRTFPNDRYRVMSEIA